jgi:uncharacterized protein DUF4389
MRPGKVVLLVVGVILALVAFGFLAGGGTLLWAYSTQRDAGGYYTTDAGSLTSQSYAVTSENVELGSKPADWVPHGIATVRIEATSSAPIFVGIGPRSAVDQYLHGVAHDVLTHVRFAPFEATYSHVGGSATPTPPGEASFWATSASGPGTKTLRWDVEAGNWVVVLMNADGSPGVAAQVTVAAKSPVLLPIGIGLLLLGLLLGAGAAGMIIASAGGGAGRQVVAVPPSPVRPGAYPVRLDGRLDPSPSRWLWLVKWFLAIPHFVVLALLWTADFVLTIIAGFAILFTGRYPRSIFEFNVGVMRWTWRVTFYALALGTDRYPPFALAADPTYPADLQVDYPERLSNGLVLVKWWLLAIPHYLVIGLFGGGFAFTAWQWGDTGAGFAGMGLIGILVLVAAISLAFTGRYLETAFDFVMGMYRWIYRVTAYAGLMRDEYPPFRLDMGGEDPGSVRPAAPIPPPPVLDEQPVGAVGRT